VCRLYGFRANEPTKVECTLVMAQNALMHQSRVDRFGKTHPDGWGIAWYEDGVPLVERRTTAAYRDLHFSTTAERMFATTVVAHVRAASVGSVTMANTHPFAYGPWSFAHNGTLHGFSAIEAELLGALPPHLAERRIGTTDSEAAFLWILAWLERHGVDLSVADPAPTVIRDALAAAVATIDRLCRRARPVKPARLNFLLTNGPIMVASRCRNSLCLVRREGIHDCEICGIPHIRHGSAPYHAAVIASEPISSEAWTEVPDRHVVVVDRSVGVSITPIDGFEPA